MDTHKRNGNDAHRELSMFFLKQTCTTAPHVFVTATFVLSSCQRGVQSTEQLIPYQFGSSPRRLISVSSKAHW